MGCFETEFGTKKDGKSDENREKEIFFMKNKTFKKTRVYFICGIGIVCFVLLAGSCSKYKQISSYSSDGLTSVQAKDGKWGYIDEKKQEVIPCIYLSVRNFDNGIAVVEKSENEYGLIDKSGKEVLPCKYSKIDTNNLNTTGVIIVRFEGKYGLVNMTGKEIVPCEYDNIKFDTEKKTRYIGNKDKNYVSFDFTGNTSHYIYKKESRKVGKINIPEEKIILLNKDTNEALEEFHLILLISTSKDFLVSKNNKFILQDIKTGEKLILNAIKASNNRGNVVTTIGILIGNKDVVQFSFDGGKNAGSLANWMEFSEGDMLNYVLEDDVLTISKQ